MAEPETEEVADWGAVGLDGGGERGRRGGESLEGAAEGAEEEAGARSGEAESPGESEEEEGESGDPSAVASAVPDPVAGGESEPTRGLS